VRALRTVADAVDADGVLRELVAVSRRPRGSPAPAPLGALLAGCCRLRESKNEARRLVLHVDRLGNDAVEAQHAVVDGTHLCTRLIGAFCARPARSRRGEAPRDDDVVAGLRAEKVIADGHLALLCLALRAPPGRLRHAQGDAAAALRGVCGLARTPSARLALVASGCVAALADVACRRGEVLCRIQPLVRVVLTELQNARARSHRSRFG